MALPVAAGRVRPLGRRLLAAVTGLAALVAVLAAAPSQAAAGTAAAGDFDVIVVGAGTGGTAAAIAAARTGASVALLEPTGMVGGQASAAGVSTMDEGGSAERFTGIYAEFARRIGDYYARRGHSVSTCYWRSGTLCADPAVIDLVLRHLLAEARGPFGNGGVTLMLRTDVARVLSSGDRVDGVVTTDGRTLLAPDTVDASELGEVVAASPAAYRNGNGTSLAPNPSACIQDVTYTATLRRYPHGVPAALRITTPPPGYTPAVAATFSRLVRANGFDWADTHGYPADLPSYLAYRGLPDLTNKRDYTGGRPSDWSRITRMQVNWGNDYPGFEPVASTGRLAVPATFLTDPRVRVQTTCDAKLRTLQLIYYLQHDLHLGQWSVADDEGFGRAGQTTQCPAFARFRAIERLFPPEPYVRESVRVIGVQTLTSPLMHRTGPPGESAGTEVDPTSIAVGYYANDLHGCGEESDLEPGLETLQDVSNPGPFSIPIGVLVPATVDGLVAAEKNISVSRLVNGAIREQPVTMATGMAAGVLAALSAHEGVPARAVDPVEVQRLLLQMHGVLDWRHPGELPQP